MIDKILQICQPLVVVVFIISGILCFVSKKWHQCAINLSIAWTNFVIFYGSSIFK